MNRIAVLVSGNGSNLQALIDACKQGIASAEIALVISNKPAVYALERAAAAGIPSRVINHKDFPDRETFDAALHRCLTEANIDFICLAGFLRLLTPAFVEKWQKRAINIHPSLLPAFKGLNTHARALAAGAKYHGCTIHYVSAGMDEGEILYQAAVPVTKQDDATTLAARILEKEHLCYPRALQQALRYLEENHG